MIVFSDVFLNTIVWCYRRLSHFAEARSISLEEQSEDFDDVELARAIAASLAMVEEATIVADISSGVQHLKYITAEDDITAGTAIAPPPAIAADVYSGERSTVVDNNLFNVASEVAAPTVPAVFDPDAWYSGLRAPVASANLADITETLVAAVRAPQLDCLCC